MSLERCCTYEKLFFLWLFDFGKIMGVKLIVEVD